MLTGGAGVNILIFEKSPTVEFFRALLTRVDCATVDGVEWLRVGEVEA